VIASVRAVLADSSSALAELFYAHFLLPFADVAQVLVFVAMIATALQRGLVQQDEHWGHAILRPVGIGLAGLGVIEVCKLAASAMLSGSLSL
jgi:hypothetical protein